MKHLPIACALSACASLVQAHEGHGLPGSTHWHANDALALVALVALAAVVGAGLWLNRKKRAPHDPR